MDHRTGFGLSHATAQRRKKTAEQIVDQAWLTLRPLLLEVVAEFLAKPPGPTVFFAFETALLGAVRELGRLLLELTVNKLEPDDPQQLPQDLWFQCGGYRRRKEKTPNRYVATLFGTVTLWRRGYRSWEDDERSIFPLQMMLGLVEGVTPGLADWLGRRMAEAGANQQRVLDALRGEHGARMGVKRLRSVTEQLSQSMAEFRQANQADALLAALQKAQESRGSRKPVLAVGRDGVTLREYVHRCFEVATAGTVSVYDRAGKRLTTVYLAWPPELGQETMSQMLTELLTEVLDRWEGPLPQLAYITDSGGQESSYYEDTLRRMIHPRTGQRLSWQRVVDYYHVAERIWTMADSLFGKDTQEGHGWAVRMLKALKKPSGASRVLHSAAGLFHRRELKPTAAKEFWRAYRYIQQRTRYMKYHEYAARHIPLGSGVTEAACKTVFTQRLKLSGMRWSAEGAHTILNLRVILLSRTWSQTYAAHLLELHPAELRPYAPPGNAPTKIAA